MLINDIFFSVCKENIWDSNLTWNSNSPNFTRCLRYTVLTWIPCAFLFVSSILEIFSLKSVTFKHSSWRALNSLRLFFTILSIMANLTEFGFYVLQYLTMDNYPYIFFVSSAIKVFAFKDKGLATLATPWIFIFLQLICFIPTITQLFLHRNTFLQFEYYYSIAYICLLIVLFVLNSFADLSSEISYKRQINNEMETDEFTRAPCPENTASFSSLILFWWFTSLANLGCKKSLVTDDIFGLNEEDKNEIIVPKFEKNWFSNSISQTNAEYVEFRSENRSIRQSIIKTILKTCWFDISLAGFLLFINCTTTLLSPILLQTILRFISSSEPLWHGIVIIIAMFSSNIIANFSMNLYYLRTSKLQVKMQCCLTNLIYKKSLRISNASKKSWTNEEVVNLISVDSQRLLTVSQHFLFICATPIIISIALWLMYNQLEFAAFGGVIFLAIITPITYFLSSLLNKYGCQQMKFKDERLKYLKEVLNGIKVIKMHAWEPPFLRLISNIRSKEVNACKKDNYLYSIIMFQWTFAPFLISFLSFALYCYSDETHVLNAEKIFVTLNIIEILNLPLSLLYQFFSYSMMAFVSLKRIDKYLNEDELENYVTRDNSNHAAEIRNGFFRWDSIENEISDNNNNDEEDYDSKRKTLTNVNVKFSLGSLHAIVGKSGSGKSSLLSALLGDMERVKGTVNIKRGLKIAYVSQKAWIENLTFRENILFGKNYDKEKFEEIIEVCALGQDLETFSTADLTEIGDKGINLTEEQKQKVALARACYSDADLYLFDDPLSAVDDQTAMHIFNNLLSSNRGLLRYKTRILVTNKLDILSKADFITVLKNGEIIEQGTFKELMKKLNDFSDFLNNFSTEDIKGSEEFDEIKKIEKRIINEENIERNRDRFIDKSPETDIVKFSTYKQYFKMIPITWIAIILTTIIGFQLSQVFGNIWLSEWSGDNKTGDARRDRKQSSYRFEIFAMIGLFQIVLGCFGNYAFITAGLEAAIMFHRNLLYRIFRSQISFFEITPLRRILSRFSKDMDNVDVVIPWIMKGVFDHFIHVFLAICVIASQTGLFIFILLPLLVGYYFIQTLYVPTSRQLRHLESITRSPIYTHFSQTLQGMSTIKAFKESNRFIKESDKRVELNLICFYALSAANGWLNVFLNLFGSLVVLFVGFYSVFQRDYLTAGMVGLIISYSLMITETMNWLVRGVTNMETNIVSVERINEYCDNEVEDEWMYECCRPPMDWPQKGCVKFEKYATRYRSEDDFVLNKLSAIINEGEKIGILSRSRLEKSTIIFSLFRILEAVKGKIMIDGVNIANFGLHDLRTKLSTIPQEPILFSGTIRFNLDPFESCGDAQIWQALQVSHLSEFVCGLENGLFYEITEGGENLTVGQRKLICLARAILRKSKILVLDEAIAAVDSETDSLIQKTIKNEFINCTIITIASRIQTIMDYDRVMVIENGAIVEFDSPSTLLSDPNSIFYSMAENAGIAVI